MIYKSKQNLVEIRVYTCEFHRKYPNGIMPKCDCSSVFVFESDIWDYCSDCDPENPKCDKCIGS